MSVENDIQTEIREAAGAQEAAALESRIEVQQAVQAALLDPVQVPREEPVVPVPPLAPPAPPIAPPAAKEPAKAAATPKPAPAAKAQDPAPLDPAAIKAAIKEAVEEAEARKPQKPAEPSAKPDTHEITTAAYKVIKGKAEEKGKKEGRREAMDEVLKAAQAAGFTSLDEAFRALAKQNQTPQAAQQVVQPTAPIAPPPAPVPPVPAAPQAAAPAVDPNKGVLEAELRKAQRERERLATAYEAERKKAETAARKQKAMAAKISAMEVDQELREAAIKEGVRDVDYAVTLLQRDLANKTDAELQAFDEAAYFRGLRTTHGHLYGERVENATTTRAVGTEPAKPPSPGQIQRQSANPEVDAMKIKREDFHARLQAMGLQPPTS